MSSRLSRIKSKCPTSLKDTDDALLNDAIKNNRTEDGKGTTDSKVGDEIFVDVSPFDAAVSNGTVLMEAPMLVQDKSLGSVSWTVWTLYYSVIQMGQSISEMARMGSSGSSGVYGGGGGAELPVEDEEEARSALINSILQLALEVELLDGTLEGSINQALPGAHVSMPGKEFKTWSQWNLWPSNMDDVMDVASSSSSSSSSVPKLPVLVDQSTFDGPMVELYIGDNTTGIGMMLRMPVSTVAYSMHTTNALRNWGIGMFVATIFFLLGLLSFSSHRRSQRELLECTLTIQHQQSDNRSRDTTENSQAEETGDGPQYRLDSEGGVTTLLSRSSRKLRVQLPAQNEGMAELL